MITDAMLKWWAVMVIINILGLLLGCSWLWFFINVLVLDPILAHEMEEDSLIRMWEALLTKLLGE